MESEKHNFVKKSLIEEDETLAAFRKKYKKQILIFKVFFISLTLIIGALIIYLVQDNTSESDQSIPLNPVVQTSNPIIGTKSQIFTVSLRTAAEELDDVTSLILSISDTNTEFALKNCWKSLRHGSGQIRYALEAMGVNPFSETLSNEEKVEMLYRIFVAEENINSCLDDLEKVESTAAIEVRTKVLQAKVYLSGRGDFLMDYYDDVWHKFWSTITAAWGMVFANLFIVCLFGLQFLFMFYLFWTISKFR